MSIASHPLLSVKPTSKRHHTLESAVALLSRQSSVPWVAADTAALAVAMSSASLACRADSEFPPLVMGWMVWEPGLAAKQGRGEKRVLAPQGKGRIRF